MKEKGIVSRVFGEKSPGVKVGDTIVIVDEGYFRPTEVDLLIGDATKAKEKLGWVPEISLEQLVEEMMQSDLKLFEKQKSIEKTTKVSKRKQRKHTSNEES